MALEFRKSMRALYGQAMAKKRKKMALYEVFSKDLSKSRGSEKLEHFKPHSINSGSKTAEPSKPFNKRTKIRPKMIQANRGRIEISMPYQVAIVLGLSLVLAVLIAYRLGEHKSLGGTEAPLDAPGTNAGVLDTIAENDTSRAEEPVREEDKLDIPLAVSSKSNWIVIKQWSNSQDLMPVQQWFTGNGIETQIRQINDKYYLHTVEKYDDPNKIDTDGYRAIQEIKRIGAEYVAPAGSAKFNLQKPYGMKAVN
jgi:hypothetical protein